MSRQYTSRKSPFVAGFLSIIPGFGQIYNEQATKGIFIFLLFVSSFFFLCVLQYPVLSVWQDPVRLFHQSNWFNDPVNLSTYRQFPLNPRLMVLTWFLVLLPLFIVFSISDAVNSARRINLQFAKAPAGPVPQGPPPDRLESKQTAVASSTLAEQETLRAEVREKIEAGAAIDPANQATMEGTRQTMNDQPTMDKEQTANQQQTQQQGPSQAPPSPPYEVRSRGISGKFLLGLILCFLGAAFILDEWNIHVFTWHHLWPLIPLLFGLRLLWEYNRDRDRGQMFLGAIATAIGAVFLVDNWNIAEPLEYIEDYWMFFLFGLGVLLLLQDFIERKRHD